MKLAEALLLRKQLAQKVKQLEPIKIQGEQGLLETKWQRKSINDQIDEIGIQVPKVSMAEFTKEFDKYATELRKIDAAIQQANWTFDVEYQALDTLR